LLQFSIDDVGKQNAIERVYICTRALITVEHVQDLLRHVQKTDSPECLLNKGNRMYNDYTFI